MCDDNVSLSSIGEYPRTISLSCGDGKLEPPTVGFYAYRLVLYVYAVTLP